MSSGSGELWSESRVRSTHQSAGKPVALASLTCFSKFKTQDLLLPLREVMDVKWMGVSEPLALRDKEGFHDASGKCFWLEGHLGNSLEPPNL